MSQPTIYQIKPEQVEGQDVMQFLRTAISREFEGKQYEIVSEQTLNRIVPGFKTPRRIVAFGIESGGESRAIYFDTTDVSVASNINWIGR